MAFNASLHPDRTDLLPKMLLGIADDLLRHVVRQRVVRLIMNGDTRHGNAPLPLGSVAAIWCGHRPACVPRHGRQRLIRAASWVAWGIAPGDRQRRHVCSRMRSGAYGKAVSEAS